MQAPNNLLKAYVLAIIQCHLIRIPNDKFILNGCNSLDN